MIDDNRDAGALMPLMAPKCAPLLLDGKPLEDRLQWYMRPRRPYSRRELLADRIVNFAGVAGAWFGAPLLSFVSWSAGDSLQKQLGFLAFGIGMITMLSCSAFYHYQSWDWKRVRLLYSLDHIGISAMIMGCYAPVMIQSKCYIVLAFVWSLGSIGLLIEVSKVMQHAFQTQGEDRNSENGCRVSKWTTMDWLNLVRYLLMGWAVVPALPTVYHCFPAVALVSMVVGGVLYTGGVVFLIASEIEFHMAIWHLFVLVASICFYLPNLFAIAGKDSAEALLIQIKHTL